MGPKLHVIKKGEDLDTDGEEITVVENGGKSVTLAELFGAGVSVASLDSSSTGSNGKPTGTESSTAHSVGSRQRLTWRRMLRG